MSSPLINWDDFGNQALVVQELLSHPEETSYHNFTPEMEESEDSQLIISKIEEPQGLLSPDTSLDTVEKIMSVSPLKNVNVKYADKQKNVEFRTPLKDCTNNGQRDVKLMNDSTKVTPVKCISSEESSSALCPSSAEFREFLSGIMEVSIVDNCSSFEDPGGEAVKQCQSPVATDSAEDEPERKARARSGTYSLASPTFDLGGLCGPEGTTSLHEVGLSTKLSSDFLMSDIKADTASKNTDEITLFPNDCFTHKNDTVKMFSKEHDSQEHGLEISENDGVDNCSQALKDSTDVQNELLVAIGDGLNTNTLKPIQRQLSKKLNLRRPLLGLKAGYKSFDSDGKQKASSLQIGDPGPASLLLEESASHMNIGEPFVSEANIENEKPIPDKDNQLGKKNEPDCISENIVESLKIEFNETTNIIVNVSNSEDICTASQKTLDIVHKQVPMLKKRVSASNLPSKVSTKVEQHTSNIVTNKASHTKLPLMGSKLPLKRPSIGLTNSTASIATSKAVQDGKVKGSDTVRLPKTIEKQQSGIPSLGNGETLGARKLLLKPSFGASSKIGDPSRRASNIQQPTDRLRMKTKVIEEENVKIMKPQDLHLINPTKKPCASKLATNITRKPPLVKGILNASTVVKDTSVLIKPPPPVMDASRTFFKDTVKGPMEASAPTDGSRTITKKTSPVKALISANGSRTVSIEDQPLISRTVTKEDQPVISRTVTKEDQPVMSRTVTKEDQPVMSRTVTKVDQPVGFRTVTKTSDGQSSHASGNYPSTPFKGDILLVPRRLSNVFHTPSSLSDNVSNSDTRQNSLIPTPIRSSCTRSNSSHSSVSSDSSFKKPSSASPFSDSRPKVALVQNTPDVRQRRLSMWSPVQKNRTVGADLAFQCTKKFRDSQDGSVG